MRFSKNTEPNVDNDYSSNFEFHIVRAGTHDVFSSAFIFPLTAEWALRALIDLILSNARRFYSSMGNPLAGKGLISNHCLIRCLSFTTFSFESLFKKIGRNEIDRSHFVCSANNPVQLSCILWQLPPALIELWAVFLEDRMRNCQLLSVPRQMFTYHVEETAGKPRHNYSNCFILYIVYWLQWMKGICHTWYTGLHFSPSLPGDRYQKIRSKTHHQKEFSRNILR